MAEFKNLILPNGFIYSGKLVTHCVIRSLGTEDMDYLRDRRRTQADLAAGWSPLDVIVRRNIVEMGDYSDGDQWEKKRIIDIMYNEFMHLPDALFLAVETRILGVDEEYRFMRPCRWCNKPMHPTVMLTDLPVDDQPADYQGKSRITRPLVMPNGRELGKVVTFRPLLARDGVAIREIKRVSEEERATQEVRLQLIEIDGVPVNDASIKALGYKGMLALNHVMQESCGGYDLTIDHECSECERADQFLMPIDAFDFLLPGRLSTREKVTTATPSRRLGIGEKSFRSGDRGLGTKPSPGENSNGTPGG